MLPNLVMFWSALVTCSWVVGSICILANVWQLLFAVRLGDEINILEKLSKLSGCIMSSRTQCSLKINYPGLSCSQTRRSAWIAVRPPPRTFHDSSTSWVVSCICTGLGEGGGWCWRLPVSLFLFGISHQSCRPCPDNYIPIGYVRDKGV